MCGIAGYVISRGSFTADPLLPMLDSILHRGPDSGGTWIDPTAGVALGHRRLSIVDLSPAGHQPMVSVCGRYVITFNGEIYNHRDLRTRLDRNGATPSGGWRGHSDTETLLAAIVAWGLREALKNSVGMFAFALWDARDRSLTLARDRIGEKPLYYGWQGDAFIFASELKAIRQHPSFLGDIDWRAANTFLRLNFIPAPFSVYRDLYKLLPGSFLVMSRDQIDARSLSVPQEYWSLSAVVAGNSGRTFAGDFVDAVDELDNLLSDAVRGQAQADVPLGAFLSGGIDSSVVVAMMRRNSSSAVTTFSIGMPDSGMDESTHALAIARHLNTDHIAHTIKSTEALELIPSLTEIWDEPFADSSQIPTLLVSKIARTRVTVALSGDGGDEFFLGYNLYSLYARLWRWRQLGRLPWDEALGLLDLFDGISGVAKARNRARSVVTAWRQPDTQMLARYWFDRYRGGRVPLREQNSLPMIELPRLAGVAETAGLWDAGTYLPDDILTKVDRASMATSLETRAPLLDHRVLEFALSLPEHFKTDRHLGKKVLREVLYRYVPKAIVDRPKTGFSIPLSQWLRRDLRDWAQTLVDSIPVDGSVFDKAAIDDMWSAHLGGSDHTERIWGVLSLASFIRARRH